MCGIAGVIAGDGEKVSRDFLTELAKTLNHRGPDSFGIVNKENVGLVHTRLAIIDLHNGQQPIFDESGRYGLVYNGELYNYKILRKELIGKGYKFDTNSDSEVILISFIHWGKKCVERFRGMFAFAVFDFGKKSVFLSRDHIGIKPLCYYNKDGKFVFSSELQTFNKLSSIKKSLNLGALDNYLWLSYIPAPKSIYNEVQKLPPAHRMEVSFEGEIKYVERYWDVKYEPDNSLTFNDWIDFTHEKITESIKMHLVSDVGFGAFLSGGIDSTLVASYMSELASEQVKTFSIAFDEAAFNEIDYAKEASEVLGLDHTFKIVKADVIEMLPKIVELYGEPYGDSSAMPTFYVSELARKDVKMVLSGDGGDEAFLGYNRYKVWDKKLRTRLGVSKLKGMFLPIAHKLNPDRYSSLYPKATAKSFLSTIDYIAEDRRYLLWKDDYHEYISNHWKDIEEKIKVKKRLNNYNKGQYIDLHSYLPYDILNKVDIASMANSLEVRTPLVDKDIFEFAGKIPPNFNLQKKNGVLEPKFLLKKLLEKKFSDKFIYRPKSGFSLPFDIWFNPNNGKLSSYIRERLLDPNAKINLFFNSKAITNMVNSTSNSGGTSYSGSIWLLLFLEEWLEQNRID